MPGHSAKLLRTTTVFLVGDIQAAMAWYKRLGFQAQYFPPGFAILSRDKIEIFLQHQPGYTAPPDPGRQEREAWNLYLVTDDLDRLYRQYTADPAIAIGRPICPQEYGMREFDVIDPFGHRLVFAQPLDG